jgi:hypothetical protein
LSQLDNDRQGCDMNKASDTSMLEALAREIHAPVDKVMTLFERERDELARGATITNYITLLAVRRVRQQLAADAR